MDIKLTDDQALKSVISEALLRAVDANTRETLIKAAIEKLLSPEESGGNYYGAPKKRSALQKAFDAAIEGYAYKYAIQVIDSDEALQGQIKAVFAEATELAFVKNKDATVQRVATAMSEGLWKNDR